MDAAKQRMVPLGVSGETSSQQSGGRVTVNILTVDLEDWFHICEAEEYLPRRNWDYLPSTVITDTTKLLEQLQAFGVRATFFVLGYVAERHPELIARIHRLGHEIAYHGWDHELVYRLTPREFGRVLRRGAACLRAITGSRPVGFRAPQWSINDRSIWALEVLAAEGYEYDSSMAPLRFIGNESYPRQPHRLKTPAGCLWELPPLVMPTHWGNYPAGGGWGLRCLPYPVLQYEVRCLNRRLLPALFYFHPREFGCQKTVTGLPYIKRFVVHAGIWSTQRQLARLLNSFRFASVAQVLDSIRSADRVSSPSFLTASP
jgi:polysaccharide deacetylase family protein (PEP-CTERM system associated)